MINTLIVLLLTAGGAALYRWRGSEDNPRPLPHLAFASLFGIAMLTHQHFTWQILVCAAIVFGLTYGAVRLGHKAYMDQGIGDTTDDQWYGAWMRRFGFGPRLHAFLGMAISGLLIALPGVLGFCYGGHVGAALVLLLGGTLKSVAYWAGVYAYERHWVDDSVPASEILTGAFLWGGCALAIMAAQ